MAYLPAGHQRKGQIKLAMNRAIPAPIVGWYASPWKFEGSK
jgi:hypothetical protein